MVAERQPRLLVTIIICISSFLLSCSKKEETVYEVSCNKRVAPNYNGPSEASYCTSVTSYSSYITVTGSGKYFARTYDTNGLGDPDAGNPIRHAEVEVKNSSGKRIQCGETDASGNFSIKVPTNTKNYTLYIRSRASNSYAKASVLNCPEENSAYQISKSFTPDSNKDIGELSAFATGEILGAAFNILDKIVEANQYLRTEVGTCPFTGCSDFTVAPKVTAYWQKGYNPYNYFGESAGLSFYLPGESKLFILGGQGGDTDYTDTDHFDNSVIIHEYGHFLEDIYTKSDSPGGSHSGNKVIDPRLAWGEGWGNFFQAAVLNDPTYIDTSGNKDGSTSYIFKISLEEPNASCTPSSTTSGCDIPTNNYEGQFREFAITRFLWDIIDDDTETGDNMNGTTSGIGFAEIWATLVSTAGFMNSTIAFRDAGLLNYTQINALTGSTTANWTDIRTDTNSGLKHFQGSDRKEYGYHIDNTGSCSANNFTMAPYNDTNDTGSFSTSNQFYNNDFFHYIHSGGPLSLTLNYTTTGGSQEADLDLYVYGEGYVYGYSDYIKASSENIFDNDTSTTESESISKNLPAGNYLINVKLYTGEMTGSVCQNGLCPGDWLPIADNTDYELLINGVRACPTDVP